MSTIQTLIEVFEQHGLKIEPSESTDYVDIRKMLFHIYDELCPTLIPFYEKHLEAMPLEFFGHPNQDLDRRIFIQSGTMQT